MKIANQIMPHKMPHFVCEKCHFKCSKESNYKKHIVTNKHNMLIDANNIMPNNESNTVICICGKKYNHHSSFSRHKRTCIKIKKHESTYVTKEDYVNTINHVSISNDNNDKLIYSHSPGDSIPSKDELLLKLIKDNDEMMKIIKGQQEQINSIIPKIGNIINNNNTTMNNNFNLNVFLNEKCKDALNISDFIDSLKITLEDLIFSKTNGISRGITDVLIKGLKELDIHKRPIHCTDIKRDIMYIKDEDKWQKDENHDMMKNTIVKIADMERTALQQWAIDNPDWIETERKQIEYLTMMRSICEPIENYNNYERKIIKNLGKEILIDKKN